MLIHQNRDICKKQLRAEFAANLSKLQRTMVMFTPPRRPPKTLQ